MSKSYRVGIEIELTTETLPLPLPSWQVDRSSVDGWRFRECRIKDVVDHDDSDTVIGALRLIVECACWGNFVGLALAASG